MPENKCVIADRPLSPQGAFCVRRPLAHPVKRAKRVSRVQYTSSFMLHSPNPAQFYIITTTQVTSSIPTLCHPAIFQLMQSLYRLKAVSPEGPLLQGYAHVYQTTEGLALLQARPALGSSCQKCGEEDRACFLPPLTIMTVSTL